MALTPEDVVNKRFQPTKFREGYDQDEVDDFLDEVVVELRRLNRENEELRSRLVAGGAEQNTPSSSDTGRTAVVAEPETADVAPAPVSAAPAVAAPAASGSDLDEETSSTSSLLQLARRLHDEHVREGVEKRDALIAEAQATSERLLAEGQASAEQLRTETEAEHRTRVDALEEERRGLEERIDGLRVFEQEYRQQLRNYIEGQLRDLDSSAAVAGEAEHAGAGVSGSSDFAGN
jgi:DivIVA domain-containing protein